MDQTYKYTSDQDSSGAEKPVLYINKQLIKFPGKYIRVFDSHMRLLTKAHSLPFKLREKLNIYSDEDRTNIIATAETKKIIDFNVAFVIRQPEDGKPLGGIRRKGLTSEFLRDAWLIYDSEGEEIAVLQEPNIHFSLIRRWILPFIPQTYEMSLKDGSASLIIKQTWTPVLLRYRVYSNDYQKFTKKIPQKLLATILCTIAAIEGDG